MVWCIYFFLCIWMVDNLGKLESFLKWVRFVWWLIEYFCLIKWRMYLFILRKDGWEEKLLCRWSEVGFWNEIGLFGYDGLIDGGGKWWRKLCCVGYSFFCGIVILFYDLVWDCVFGFYVLWIFLCVVEFVFNVVVWLL